MAKSDHKRHAAKHKIDRRLGVNLWGRPKSPVNAREYGPGQHGQRRKKPTDFGVQLMAKQKLKGYYGNIGENNLKNIIMKRYAAKAIQAKIWWGFWNVVLMPCCIAQNSSQQCFLRARPLTMVTYC